MYANQLTLDLETTKEQASLNLAFIGILLNFTSHLLKAHILTPSLKYYARRYGKERGDLHADERLRSSLSVLQASLGTDARLLVRDYKAKWRIK